MSNVAHIRLAIKGKGMVLTKRKKRNGSLDHLADTTIRFAPALRVEDSQQLGVAIIAFGRVEKSPDEAPGSIFCGRGTQIQAKGRKDLCRIALELLELFLWNFAHLQFHRCLKCNIVRVIMV